MTIDEGPQWLTVEDVTMLHARQLFEHGGLEGVRDENALRSAVDRPRNLHAYSDPKPTLAELAASLAFGLARNHPFNDGNKRTAVAGCEFFLMLNGRSLTAGNDELYPVFYNLAAGTVGEDELSAFLAANTEAA